MLFFKAFLLPINFYFKIFENKKHFYSSHFLLKVLKSDIQIKIIWKIEDNIARNCIACKVHHSKAGFFFLLSSPF